MIQEIIKKIDSIFLKVLKYLENIKIFVNRKLVYYLFILNHFYYVHLDKYFSKIEEHIYGLQIYYLVIFNHFYYMHLYWYFSKIKKYIYDFEDYYEKKFSHIDNEILKKNQIIKQNKSLIFKETVVMLIRRQKQKFYLPFNSFWPLILTASVSLFLILICVFFHSSKLFSHLNGLILLALFAVIVSISFWFSIFYIEKKMGNHVIDIRRNIELGFYLFLFTEALCFIALFWVFLHSFLAAGIHGGIYNPGEGIANLYLNEPVKISKNWNVYGFNPVGTPCFYRVSSVYTLADRELYDGVKNFFIHINFYDKGQLIDPYKLPLLNTFILLTSAAFLNLSHINTRTSNYLKSFLFLFITITLGLFFVFVQYKEYKDCSFQFNDGIYAACFFSLTGLHGVHVMIGISALIVCAINLLFNNYSPSSHQSFIYSIFYWHFVDVIWIFVYFIMYLWPAYYFYVDEIYVTYKNFFTIHFSKNIFFEVIEFNNYIISKKNSRIFYWNLFNHFNKEFANFDYFNNIIINKVMCNCDKSVNSKWNTILVVLNNNNFEAFKFDFCVINDKVCNWNYLENIIINPCVSCIKFFKYFGYENINKYSFKEFSSCIMYGINLFIELKFFHPNYEKVDFNNLNQKLFFLECEKFVLLISSLFTNRDVEYEYACDQLYKNRKFINFNEIKRDPDGICFILTVMHNELIHSIQNLLAIDASKKYKRFFILILLKFFGLFYFELVWCYFFFPYLIFVDASVRYNI